MLRSRRGPVRAIVVVFVMWVGLYVAVAHGLGAMSMEEKALHGAGICLVVLAVTAAVSVAAANRHLSLAIEPALYAVQVRSPAPSRFAVPSRASPAWLQLFLN